MAHLRPGTDERTLAFLADLEQLTPPARIDPIENPDDVAAVIRVDYDQRRDVIDLALKHQLTLDSVNRTSCYIDTEPTGTPNALEVLADPYEYTPDEVALAYAQALIAANRNVTAVLATATADALNGAALIAAAHDTGHTLKTTALMELLTLRMQINDIFTAMTNDIALRVRSILFRGTFGDEPPTGTPLEDTLATLLLDAGLERATPTSVASTAEVHTVLTQHGHLIATAIELTR